MPELPEVEVTRQRIAPKLVGRTVRKVHVVPSSYFFLTPPAELAKRLTGRRIAALARHGKYLIATLDDDARLLMHLGMTGQLFTASARSVRLLRSTGTGTLAPEVQGSFVSDVHTHLRLTFDDGDEDVLFRDVRKFGKVLWLPKGANDARLTKLGPDALTVTGALLYEETRGRKAPALPRGHSATTQRQEPHAQGERAPRRRDPRRALALDRDGRLQHQRLRAAGRKRRRLSERAARVRAQGRGVLRLRRRDSPHRARRAQHALLSDLPTIGDQ
jgi:hypothetical protein